MDEVVQDSSVSDLQGFTVNGTKLFFSNHDHKYWRLDSQGNRVDVPGVTTVLGVIDKSQPLMKWAVRLAIETIREGLVSETGALKPLATEDLFVLLEEARNKHKERLDVAGDIGHLAHNALEKTILYALEYTNGVVQERIAPPTNPLALSCYNAAIDWMAAHNVRWLHTERKVYSHLYDVSGTTDGVAIVDSCSDPHCCRDRKFRDRKAIVDWKSTNQFTPSQAAQSALYLQAFTAETGEIVPDRWVNKLGKEDGKFQSWYQPQEQYAGHLRMFVAALDLFRLVEGVKKQMSAGKAELRALLKAEREVFKASEKRREQERRQARKDAIREARDQAKAKYKELRAAKIPVVEAKAQSDEWLTQRLAQIDLEHGKVADVQEAVAEQRDPEPAFDLYEPFTV